MKKSVHRHDVIRDIVRREAIHTQRDLVAKLQELGYECTQATVSRDIANIGLLKSQDGLYVLPEDMRLYHMLSEIVGEIHVAGHSVVVRTNPGIAPGVADAIDNVHIEGLLGTVAGDNTILIIAYSPEDAKFVKQRLLELKRHFKRI